MRTIQEADSKLAELQSSVDTLAVLHGDLHHDNLLRSSREPWLAIDPKGRIGEPVCEFAGLIRNPIDQLGRVSELRLFLSRRVDQLVEHTGHDRSRLVGWARVLAVAACCWQLEDEDIASDAWLRVAAALA